MLGTRRDDETEPHVFNPGDYGFYKGILYGRPPTETGVFLLASLERHHVAHNADGTITIVPSILVRDGQSEWHGYLESGVWRVA